MTDTALSATVSTTAPPSPPSAASTTAGPAQRIAWPAPTGPAAPAVLIGAGGAGLVAAVALPADRPGIGWLIVGLSVTTAVALAWRQRRSRGVPSIERWLWTGATLALIAVGTFRAAEWLFALCVSAAIGTASIALARGRTVAGIQAGLVCLPIACLRGIPWAGRGLARLRGRMGRSPARLVRSVVVTGVLVVVFGALFASADAVFADLLATLVPTVDGASVVWRMLLFTLIATATVGACCLLVAPPVLDLPNTGGVSVRRFEWALPVGVLLVMFASFVLVQLTVLFGGRDYMLRTADLTAADYARHGFWQLSAVTVLALVVIGVAARRAPRTTRADRILLRALLGGLAGLTLVIVASALTRLWAYQESFGYSVLRLLVGVCELWLGVVYLMVLATGIRLRAGWLPRAMLGSAVGALLILAVVNPEGYVADRNVARYARTGQIDVGYLAGLSPDAAPELARLPDPVRSCVLSEARSRLSGFGSDPWYAWNLARANAQVLLDGAYLRPNPDCGDR